MFTAYARSKATTPWYRTKAAKRVLAVLVGGVLAAGCSFLPRNWMQPICAALAKMVSLIGM